jgi:iron complex transport system substrate-binding protein
VIKKTITFLLAAALCSSVFAGCSQTQQPKNDGNLRNSTAQEQNPSQAENHYPVTLKVYTDEGKEITQLIKKEPQKVVVIGQALAELMIAFGQEDKVVGVGYLDKSYSKYADQICQMPIITDSWPSKEAVLALQPDIIISMSSAFRDERLGDISFWNERGIPVLLAINFTIGRSIDEYFMDITNLGIAFNIEDKTNTYVEEQKNKINKIKKIAETAKTSPKVLLVASGGRETYDYYPPSLCVIDEMIEGAGGEYMKLSEDGYVEMSIESIIAANPDKIIITEFQKSNSEVSKNKLLLNERLQNVTAIKSGNVMAADYTNAIRGSLELANLYEDVAEFIHPELFGGE